jgi:menaquinone-9 beta-reductase
LPVFDALIIGASLAGSTAAVRLARQGFRVLLIDRQSFPRGKICGEGLMPAGVGLLGEVGVKAGCVGQGARPFQGLRFLLPDTDLSLNFPNYQDQPGWITPRINLDARLVETAAAQRGVECRLGARLESLEAGPRQVAVRVREGRKTHGFSCRLLIGADGVRSQVRRSVGISSWFPSRKRFALSACFSYLREAGNAVEIHCSRWGEAYVAPRATGQVRVTLLLSSRPGGGLGGGAVQLLENALVGFPFLRGRLPSSPLGTVSATAPLGVSVRRCHADRLLLIGDAAGAVDPVTGQGMSLALRDAKLAAEVLKERLAEDRLSRNHLAHFSELRRSYFRAASDLANLLLFLLQHPSWAGKALRAIGNNVQLRNKLSTLASGHHPSPALTWMDRLHLLLGR